MRCVSRRSLELAAVDQNVLARGDGIPDVDGRIAARRMGQLCGRARRAVLRCVAAEDVALRAQLANGVLVQANPGPAAVEDVVMSGVRPGGGGAEVDLREVVAAVP